MSVESHTIQDVISILQHHKEKLGGDLNVRLQVGSLEFQVDDIIIGRSKKAVKPHLTLVAGTTLKGNRGD